MEKTKISNQKDEESLNFGKGISQLEQIILFCCLYVNFNILKTLNKMIKLKYLKYPFFKLRFDYQKNNPQHELTLEETLPIIEVFF